MDLLQSLATETGQQISDLKLSGLATESNAKEKWKARSSFEDNVQLESLPLSEEDILKKPFYTVEEPTNVKENAAQGNLQI